MTCKCTTKCSFTLHTKVLSVVDLIKDSRTALQRCGHTKSSAYIFDKLLARRELCDNKHVVRFEFGGVSICGDVWCKLHGLRLHDSRMKRVLASLRAGDSVWVSSTSKAGSNLDKKRGWRGMWCSAWMRRHVKKFADFNPVNLTASLDPDALETRHILYQIDWHRRPSGSRAGTALQFSRFTDLWRDMVQAGYTEGGKTYAVVKRKPRSGFSCNICQLLMERRRQARGETAKQSITHELHQHLQQVYAHTHVYMYLYIQMYIYTCVITQCTHVFTHTCAHAHVMHTHTTGT